ncbi:MAG: transglutaminase family protein [Myxococcota bacterium]
MKRIIVTHRSHYQLTRPARSARLTHRLIPCTVEQQRCLDHRLDTMPPSSGSGDYIHVKEPFRELVVVARSRVCRHGPWRGSFPPESGDYAFSPSPPIRQRALSAFVGRTAVDRCSSLVAAVRRWLAYVPTAPPATPTACLARGYGVCVDLAAVAIACFRHLGWAARFVGGYPVSARPNRRAMHAWICVFIPNRGWLELDPTAGRPCDDGYVSVAWGCRRHDVLPLVGIIDGGGEQKVSVTIDFRPDLAGRATPRGSPVGSTEFSPVWSGRILRPLIRGE